MDASTWQLAWRTSTALLYYLTYPIFLLVKTILIILTTILAPFTYLGKTLLDWSLAPFRFLVKFEALFIFLGWAVLIGCIVGVFLYTIYHTVERAFQSLGSYSSLECPPKEYSQPLDSQWDLQWDEAIGKQNRSQPLRDYFGATPTKEPAKLSDFYAEWESFKGVPSTKDTALISTTILEEEDDNHDVEY
ncbi:hypothetical protein PISL3812_05837 [Talaromyces islandicus]|uniref:Uncharacterized protein n=1 Tax=Talaromyces islandicus TaxID=28573 RepID=A0A0U1M049_TALIS|nr:hypothetical protein PISL3812_05837 [Talaromyces islandicus]